MTSETLEWKTILYVCVACIGTMLALFSFFAGWYYSIVRPRPCPPSESDRIQVKVSAEVGDCKEQKTKEKEKNLFLKEGMTWKEYLLTMEEKTHGRRVLGSTSVSYGGEFNGHMAGDISGGIGCDRGKGSGGDGGVYTGGGDGGGCSGGDGGGGAACGGGGGGGFGGCGGCGGP